MRPSLLNPLFASVTTLSGVGPKLDKLLRRLTGRDDGARVADLLFHLPAGTIDRRARPKLRDVVPGTVATVEVTIDRHRAPPPGRSRAPYLVYASDETGDLVLTYFSAHTDYIEKLLPIGERRYISGMTALYDGMLQMVHPDRVVDEAGLAKLPLVEPVYPLTEGLFASQLRRAIEGAIDRLPALPEWQDPAYLAREGFPSFADALRLVHRPAVPADILPTSPAWSRLAYDELLAGQLALGLMRAHMRRVSGRRTVGDGRLRERIIAALPYSLTASQVRALADIAADLGQPHRMLRLLQGDVGSGKTVVALLACAAVIEAGRQAAIMAPTEILARQHLATIAPVAEAAGLRIALLTGRERGRARSDMLARLAAGEIDLLVGTHALFEDEVAFRDLALAVVDEQHRFGVHQRLALARKGEAVDVLVMTATPIPRTLVLTYFGDMDISELREKPAGRKPIDTRTIPLGRIDDVRHGQLRPGRDPAAGRHNGDRGGSRRAGGDRHGDRARGALRARAAPPVARPHRPRVRALILSAALPRAARRDREGAARHHARDRGRVPHRRGRLEAARRRRCARDPPERHAGIPPRPHRDPRQAVAGRARRRRARAGARSGAHRRARRGAADLALFVRTRRGDPADPRGVKR